MKLNCLLTKKQNNITIEGFDIGYNKSGVGQNLVLLPGTLGDSRIFCRVIDRLSKEFTIYAFDHILVKDIQRAIEVLHSVFLELIGESFHLFGTSVGGYLAQHYAERYPENIRSLIISNSFCDNSELRRKNLLSYYLSKLIPLSILKKIMLSPLLKSINNLEDRLIQKQYFESVIDNIGKEKLRQRLNWSLSKMDLPKIKADIPMFIITVADDPVFPKLTYAKLENYYKQAKIIELNSGAHFPYILNPKEFEKAIIKFIISEI